MFNFNWLFELVAQEDQAVQLLTDETPEAVPTLTEEEYQEMIGIENAGVTPEP